MTAVSERPFVGHECSLYYNTGTRASAVLVEIAKARNVTCNMAAGEAEVASRESVWKMKREGLREFEITFSYAKKAGTDTVFDYLIAAAIAGTIVDLWMLDGAYTLTGAQGPRGYCQLFDVSHTQELEGVEEVEFVAKGTYFEISNVLTPPDWYEVPTP